MVLGFRGLRFSKEIFFGGGGHISRSNSMQAEIYSSGTSAVTHPQTKFGSKSLHDAAL